MAVDSLSSRLQMALRRVTGKGKLNESDIDDMLKEVRLSLLEADVNYKVVKDFFCSVYHSKRFFISVGTSFGNVVQLAPIMFGRVL